MLFNENLDQQKYGEKRRVETEATQNGSLSIMLGFAWIFHMRCRNVESDGSLVVRGLLDIVSTRRTRLE